MPAYALPAGFPPAGGVTHDPNALRAFRNAIWDIAADNRPPRSLLRQIGKELAVIAGRARPWGSAHLYNLLNLHRLTHPEKYGLHLDLYLAAMKRAGMKLENGATRTIVLARSVRAGALILGTSRCCARRRCRVHFVGRTPGQLYCSDYCSERMKAYRRKEQRRKRREKPRRKPRQAINERVTARQFNSHLLRHCR